MEKYWKMYYPGKINKEFVFADNFLIIYKFYLQIVVTDMKNKKNILISYLLVIEHNLILSITERQFRQ